MVAGCTRLITGDYADTDLIMALGGPAASKFLDGRPHADQYWLRVWGTRGLLWAWDDSGATASTRAVTTALHDESWRVREMAAKVVARHALGDVLLVVTELRNDPVPRVRAAANRAVKLLTEAGA